VTVPTAGGEIEDGLDTITSRKDSIQSPEMSNRGVSLQGLDVVAGAEEQTPASRSPVLLEPESLPLDPAGERKLAALASSGLLLLEPSNPNPRDNKP